MSLVKSETRRQKVIEQNRQLRKLGLGNLTDPGPWFAIQPSYQFDPAFFAGLTAQTTAIDKEPMR